MLKPVSSLFAKILSWFFLNLVLVAAALAVFFAFQPQVNLHAIFGQQGSYRLRTAGMLISHDLDQTSQTNWSNVLARHAQIHGVDFVLVLKDGSRFSSNDMELPKEIIKRVKGALRGRPPKGAFPPPPVFDEPPRPLKNRTSKDTGDFPNKSDIKRKPPERPRDNDKKPRLMMRTQNPTRFFRGIAR